MEKTKTELFLEKNFCIQIFENINTTEKDENSVLKESLSFIFFEDENLSQAEKDLEFQKLLCNENLKDENKDLHQVVLCKHNYVKIYTNK